MLIQNPPRAGSTGNAGKYRRRVPEWEEYAHTPAVFVRAANKGLKCYVNWESAQRKETEGLLRRVLQRGVALEMNPGQGGCVPPSVVDSAQAPPCLSAFPLCALGVLCDLCVKSFFFFRPSTFDSQLSSPSDLSPFHDGRYATLLESTRCALFPSSRYPRTTSKIRLPVRSPALSGGRLPWSLRSRTLTEALFHGLGMLSQTPEIRPAPKGRPGDLPPLTGHGTRLHGPRNTDHRSRGFSAGSASCW